MKPLTNEATLNAYSIGNVPDWLTAQAEAPPHLISHQKYKNSMIYLELT